MGNEVGDRQVDPGKSGLNTQTRWIPCSERKPADIESVFVTVKGHDLIIPKEGETFEAAWVRVMSERWVTIAYWDETEGCWCNELGGTLMVQPIAWMPMRRPDPWDGEA